MHGQKFRKPLYALRVSSTTPSSAHEHHTMALTVERSQPRGRGSRGPNLTPSDHGRATPAYEDGRTLKSIADQFERAPSTISRTMHGASQNNQGTELPRTGHPQTYTSHDHRRVALAVERHPFWSYDKIQRWYGFK